MFYQFFIHSSNRYMYAKKLSMSFWTSSFYRLEIQYIFFVHVLLSLKAEICTFSYFDDDKKDFRDK